MKKTIVAAAIAAVVSAPAMAEVSISGFVNQEFIDQDGTTGWGASGMNSDIVIKSTEDLGNGLKATAKVHTFIDTNNNANASTDVASATSGDDTDGTGRTADLSVTISGDFGSVVAGRFEPASEGVIDAFMNIDASHDLDLENATENAIARTNNGLAYTSPSMNGFSVSLGNFASAGSTDDGDFNGAQEIFVKYSNGPLAVMANSTEVDGGAEIQAIAASYKMGDLEVRAMERSSNSGVAGSADIDLTFIGAKYTMGANTFAIGTADSDTNSKDTDIISVSHAMSKNTSIYITQENVDAANSDRTAIGIATKF
jgi:predicted porin